MRRLTALVALSVIRMAVVGGASAIGTPCASTEEPPVIYTHWKRYTTRDGLPSDHVRVIKIHEDKVWAGTEEGLACLDKRTRRIDRWREEDGLSFPVVSAIDVDARTGDVWIGTYGGGIARLSGGRLDSFNQMNSGLANDVVTGVIVRENHVWASTLSGTCRYDARDQEWTSYNDKNTPGEEYRHTGVWSHAGLIRVGAGSGGLLEFDIDASLWRVCSFFARKHAVDAADSDVSNQQAVITGVDVAEGVLWASSWSGALRQEGRDLVRLRFQDDDALERRSFLAVDARDAREAWFAADDGVYVMIDPRSRTWIKYAPDNTGSGGHAIVKSRGQVIREAELGVDSPSLGVSAVALDGSGVWVGDGSGLAWGDGSRVEPASLAMPHDVLREDRLRPTRRRKENERARSHAPPAALDAVKIGFIGPIARPVAPGPRRPADLDGVLMLNAARLAVDEANARGGYRGRGLPYALIARTDQNLWGSVANEVVKLAYRDRALAILSASTGERIRVALHAATGARIVILNAGSRDPNLCRLETPWIASIAPDDEERSSRFSRFRMKFKDLHGREPSLASTRVYDGMTMLIGVIDKSGLDRERIRDALIGKPRKTVSRKNRLSFRVQTLLR